MEAFKEKIEYEFICNGCGSLIVAESNEFEVIDRGVLRYRCPVCKQRRKIKYKGLTKSVKYVKYGDDGNKSS